MKTAIHRSAMLLVSVLGLSVCTSAMAETAWQKAHPRRTEVNHRLERQNVRIDKQVHSGTITHQQAHTLHKQDQQIRQEERDMASQNNGHITKSERKVLNQQENGVSKDIGK